MKRSLVVILLLAGLLMPAKQVCAQYSSQMSNLKNREIPFKRSHVKPGKDGKTKLDLSKTQKSNQKAQKAAGMTYQEVTSLPFSNSSALDEDSYLLGFPYFAYAEGYEITLTKGQTVHVSQESEVFDCCLYILDSNYNVIALNDDYYYENDGDYNNSQIFFYPFYTGTYYIVAAQYSFYDELGDYNITIDDHMESLSPQAYYVDAVNGNNSNTGETPAEAKQSIQSLLATVTNGTIYIMSDIDVDETIVIEDAVICLAPYNNGDFTIKRTADMDEDSHIVEVLRSILYLSDEGIGGTLTLDGGYSKAIPIVTYGAILAVDMNSIVMMSPAITVQNNYTDFDAAPAIYTEGLFYMYGGTILDNTGDFGNAVISAGTFLMFDGNITNNTSNSCSGVLNGNLFIMYDGMISDNVAISDHCGVTNDWAFVMRGGTISDNVAYMAAGVVNYAYMEMSDGVIADNEAEMMSSGVVNEEDALMILSGGSISGNVSLDIPNQGLTHVGEYCMLTDSINIGSDNLIFLLEDNTIEVSGRSTYRTVGTIMPFKFDEDEDPTYAHRSGLQVLSGTPADIAAIYGSFQVADDEDGNQWSIDSEGKLYSSVSVSDLTNNSAFEIYPNPATNVLYLHLNNLDLEQVTMNIYDMYGKLIQQVGINNTSQAINIEHLSAGVYVMQLLNNGQMIDCRKIVKE